MRRSLAQLFLPADRFEVLRKTPAPLRRDEKILIIIISTSFREAESFSMHMNLFQQQNRNLKLLARSENVQVEIRTDGRPTSSRASPSKAPTPPK